MCAQVAAPRNYLNVSFFGLNYRRADDLDSVAVKPIANRRRVQPMDARGWSSKTAKWRAEPPRTVTLPLGATRE